MIFLIIGTLLQFSSFKIGSSLPDFLNDNTNLEWYHDIPDNQYNMLVEQVLSADHCFMPDIETLPDAEIVCDTIYKVYILRDLQYLSSDREEKMDIYYPVDADDPKRFPGIVMVHGGGWVGGDKARRREQEICRYLASQGYVCASINYKLAIDSPAWPQNVLDCKNAVKFLRSKHAEFKIDTCSIGIIGGSAGGHLALMVGFTNGIADLEPDDPYPGYSSHVQAVVDMYGISNLLSRQYTDSAGNPTGQFKEGTGSKYLGKNSLEGKELWRAASPVNYISDDDPPVLILHGKKDTTVDYFQSLELDSLLEKHHVPHELILLDETGHTFSFSNDVNGNKLPVDLSPMVLKFLNHFLK